MKIFDLKEDEVIISPEMLTIDVFNTIWIKDKTKNKINAFNDFKYIYHLCDYNSPYSNCASYEREAKIKEEVLNNTKYTVSTEVKAGIEVYRSLLESPLTRLLDSTKRKIDDIVELFNTTKPEDYKQAKEAKDIMSGLGLIASGLKTLETEVRKERENMGAKYRGDKVVHHGFNE
jgi:hypothetical protein